MSLRQRWNPIPYVVYGVAFGVFAGALMIWGIEGDDRWQDQAGVLLEITTVTAAACVGLSYLRQFFLD
jgi:hypothetical protein